MDSYDQFCPIAKGAEVLGDRWTPLIIREMIMGATGFNEIQRGLPRISRVILAQRLRFLEHSGILRRIIGSDAKPTGYELTSAGHDLGRVIDALGQWGARWALDRPTSSELDPYLVLLWMTRHIDRSALPPRRITLQFDFPRVRPSRLWILLEQADASVCIKDPGSDPDLIITAHLEALYLIYVGRKHLEEALDSGEIQIQGSPRLARMLPIWFTWSSFASFVRKGSLSSL